MSSAPRRQPLPSLGNQAKPGRKPEPLSRFIAPGALAWAATLAAVVAATMLRAVLEDRLAHLPFILYIFPVLVAGSLGGFRLCSASTLLSLAAGWLWFVPPRYTFLKGTADDVARALVFFSAGLAISILSELTLRSRRDARRNEEQYRFLAEGLPQFVWTRDDQGRITYMNRHGLEYIGLTAAQLPGGDWSAVVHPEDHERFEDARNRARRVMDFELELRLKRASDGAYRWHLARGRPVTLGSGETRWIGTAVDIDDRRRAEQAIRHTEERYRGIVQATAEGIWIIDTEGCTSFVNQRMADLLGYTQQDMLGRSCFDFIHPDEKDQGMEGFRKRKASNDSAPREYRFVRKDGTLCWLSFIGSRMFDSSGAVTGVLAMCTDTTERRRSEERIRQLNAELAAKVAELETLLRVVPIGIAFSHEVGSRYAGLNPEAQRILALESGTGQPQGPLEMHRLSHRVLREGREVPPEELPMQLAVRTRATIADAEFDILRQDGRLIQVASWASPLLDDNGEPRGSVAAFLDISERKSAEQALRRANAALEQFAYAAAHDLQEPIRNVTLYTQLLARDYQGQLDQRADEYMSLIVESSRRMHNLIHDLLIYTRATDDFEIAAVASDARAALQEALQNLQPAIDSSQAELVCEVPSSVGVRHVQMVQLFQNLVSNAIKYRGSQPLRIHISAERQGPCWEFVVRDNGPGIPAEYHDRIFRVFKRLHGRDIPGNGIGLAICERIVSHYGGKIWVTSEPGQGAAFHFTVPDASLPA